MAEVLPVDKMGLWFSSLLSYFGEKEARILVLGLDNAGKTTILCETPFSRANVSILYDLKVVTWPDLDLCCSQIACKLAKLCQQFQVCCCLAQIMRLPMPLCTWTFESEIHSMSFSMSIQCACPCPCAHGCLSQKHFPCQSKIVFDFCRSPTIPAIGFNVETVTYKNIKFQVWDLGGQTSIRPYWRCYYPNTQAVIYVVDSSDTERIGTSAEEFHAILEEEELKDAKILVFANKQVANNTFGFVC